MRRWMRGFPAEAGARPIARRRTGAFLTDTLSCRCRVAAIESTIQNVVDSDATLIIYFASLEGGTEQTLLHCVRRRRPYKLIDAQEVSTTRAAELVLDLIDGRGGESAQRRRTAGEPQRGWLSVCV